MSAFKPWGNLWHHKASLGKTFHKQDAANNFLTHLFVSGKGLPLNSLSLE